MVMDMCDGYDDFWDVQDDLRGDLRGDRDREVNKLPCYASTVIYGHAATRGLDIKKWSKGLDTGCVRVSHFSLLLALELTNIRRRMGGN